MAWNSTRTELNSFPAPWDFIRELKMAGGQNLGVLSSVENWKAMPGGFNALCFYCSSDFCVDSSRGTGSQDRPFPFVSLDVVWKAEECGHPECYLGFCSLNMIGLRWVSFCAGTSMDMPQYQPGPSSHNMEHLPSHIVLPSTIGSVIHTISVCRYPVSQCFN